MAVAAWLSGLGTSLYTAAFQAGGVGGAAVPSLTADDLRDLGVHCAKTSRSAPKRYRDTPRDGKGG